jgi:hypothetical protein
VSSGDHDVTSDKDVGCQAVQGNSHTVQGNGQEDASRAQERQAQVPDRKALSDRHQEQHGSQQRRA